MLRVYIAGHTGTVGSALLRSKPENVELITASKRELDLTERNKVLEFLISKKPDLIIDAAAKVGGISANSRYQFEFLSENLQIQDSLISSACKVGIQNFIFLGSSCIYPKFAPQPINENELLNGPLEKTNEGYSLAKIAGILMCNAAFQEYGLNYFSLMPTNLYGPEDNYDLENSHVPAALMRRFHEAKVANASEVVVWGSGSPLREFMHVDDLASAIWFMVKQKAGGKVFNVGTGNEISIADFAKILAGVVGYHGKLIFDTSKPDGTPRKLLDVSKINSLGWQYRIELEAGLKSTYEWFLNRLEKDGVRGYK